MSRLRYATTTAVLVGSLLLFVPLSLGVLYGAVDTIGSLLDLSRRGWLVLVLATLGLAVALDTATVIAAVRLHGFSALDRGPARRRARRIGALCLTALAGFVAVIDVAVEFAAWGLAHDQRHFLVAGFTLLAAVTWVAVRAADALHQGYAG